MIKIIIKSLLNRKISVTLTVFSIGLSIALFLGVERLRLGAQKSFDNTISQTDLIVGARGSDVQLLLYTLFHIGNATNNISWQTYQHIAKNNMVAWTIPFSMGDNYHNYRVVGTDENFYTHFQFLENKHVEIKEGHASSDVFDVTLGSEVADKEKLTVGQNIILSHGIESGIKQAQHKESPFVISGILKKTGTPVDRALFITIEGDEAMHLPWHNGSYAHGDKLVTLSNIKKSDVYIQDLTSFLIGAKSRIDSLALQREINDFKGEAIMGIIPAVTLSHLWETISTIEIAFRVMTIAIIFVGLLGMVVSIYNTLDTRRREMSILRAIGARQRQVFSLLIFESFVISLKSCLLGVALCYGLLYLFQPILFTYFGLSIVLTPLIWTEYVYLVFIILFGCFLGLFPAYQAYRNTLADGLTLRF